MRVFIPAAGNANNSSMNNVGSNGYIWSSSLNSSNPYNAHNLNFNSSNVNPTNNNNRYNGFSVRGVRHSICLISGFILFNMSFKLTKKRLLFDLYIAFEKAKQHKGNKPYVKNFERNLHNNLLTLCDELWNKTYKAQPSSCFIITHPKKREVFAAAFRDRIVHHLYYEYTHELFERTFIQDSYSCIKKRGTHYGIKRLEKHIKQVTNNYNETAYVLKMDMCGYFMSINRNLLLEIANRTLIKMRQHLVTKNEKMTWDDVIDFDFVLYLTKEIVTLDPTDGCVFVSDKKDWDDLPKTKSLFHTSDGCGLPIGNLTSQLFSNVFLNELDQFVKRTLKCKHYGRYVDDAYIVSSDKLFLKKLIPIIKHFLEKKLQLKLHMGKTHIIVCKNGVEFLGAFIKPYRTYISHACLNRIKSALPTINDTLPHISPQPSINSFLGILRHYSTFNIRVLLFSGMVSLYDYGYFDTKLTKFILNDKIHKMCSN